MSLPFEIKAEDLEQVLSAWGNELAQSDFENPLRECIPTLIDDFEDHFMQAQGDNGAWAPRKDSKPHPLLILTGALLEGVRDTGNPANIHDVASNVLTLGIDSSVVMYAAYHQYGTSRMPARPFIWASEEAIDAAADKFAEAAFQFLVGA